MNIFYISDCPEYAAQWQCDKHVVKMCLETAQMLCTAYRRWEDPLPEELSTKLYKNAHVHHPMTIWVGDSTQRVHLPLWKSPRQRPITQATR